ncbi:outer membrane protein transport protein [Moraxella sp. RCAD0137]|uniref:outer membrane protein transport protein n=1 Tax=Moraxella sp. RCAD0137 TaxID=1775913 RepID=UPI000C9F8BDE|nr:outer membrane protein transport protein [Moraxella sp. RCAD0137]PNP99081.1 hypothetical protein AZ602_01355 [Moraxella sp. RCAD0137]
MSSTFGYKALSLAVVSALAATSAHSAGLDRSGQDVTAFLQDGTYAEAVYTYIDADVSGKDASGNVVPDGAEAYDFFRFGVKGDLNDRFSVGVLYDEPFGAAVQYSGNNNFVADADSALATITQRQIPNATVGNFALQQIRDGISRIDAGIEDINALERSGRITPEQAQAARTPLESQRTGLVNQEQGLQGVLNSDQQGTNVEIRTHNLTTLVGAKFGEKRNFQIYGGAAAQHLTGEVHLRGTAYLAANGYDARISPDTAVGWVAGVAYSKPEIALKAALTYRSEIEHKSTIAEVLPASGLLGNNPNSTRDFAVTLPESYNLDFQTGINPTTLLTAKVRYVPWSDFDIRPPAYGDAAERVYGKQLPIVSYDKDQWSAEVGLGKRLSDRLAVSGSVGWDSGAGNPTTTLGPIEGYYSVGLGAKYDLTPQWSLAVGGKYLKFGDADAQIPPQVGTSALSGRFEDNDGFIAGVKLAYQAK